MKKGLIVALVLAIVLGLWAKNGYNGLVEKDEVVKKYWAEVQNQYQRRMDLIPNLVETVKGAANFEQKTLTDVINARASATQMKVDVNDLSPEKIKEFQASQGQLSQALGRLMVVTENYPTLKANENFLKLQDDLAGTENRITVARKDYNDAVQMFNTSARSFPTNIFANIFNMKPRGTFEADQAAQKAPEVKF